MAAGSADASTPRPRPRPGPPAAAAAEPVDDGAPAVADAAAEIAEIAEVSAARPRRPRRRPGKGLVVAEPQPATVVATAGSAIVTAARVGRLLGRSGWRAARQLPGVAQIEQQSRRLRNAAASELLRLLDAPTGHGANGEEQRALLLAHQAGTDPAPLRSAMTELLERSTAASGAQSRDYLFGTIVSQLVPDEARILAALGTGKTFAVLDVVVKSRSGTSTVLANVSTVGAAAGVSLPDNVPTYLSRLDGFGLLDFGRGVDDLDRQYRTLETDKHVRAAQAAAERTRAGSARTVRRSVVLSDLGQQFWASCAPGAPDRGPR